MTPNSRSLSTRFPALARVARPVSPFLTPLGAFLLRGRARKANSVDELVDVAFRFRLGALTIRPNQDREELATFLGDVAARRPKIVVEIGTANGGTLFLLSRVAAPDALLISIDLPAGPFGGGYPRWRGRLYRSFTRTGQSVSLLRADSHAPETFEALRGVLGEHRIDVLFIDGDHRYEGVKSDFEMYAPLVGSDGLIAFHDICPGKPENSGGVPQYWSELRARYRTDELLLHPETGRYGIGIMRTREESESGAAGF